MICQQCKEDVGQLTKPFGGHTYMCEKCLDEWEQETI